MSVPEEIRKVKRPVNTVVVDSGSKGLKRYAVRKRNGFVYEKGTNPRPHNGKVVGHIINGRYVPIDEPIVEEEPETLSYGSSAFIKSVSDDILNDLLDTYEAGDAFTIFMIAAIRVLKKNPPNSRLAVHYSRTFLSRFYPGVHLSKNTVGALLDNLGKAAKRRRAFFERRIARVCAEHHIAIDGMLRQDTSAINDLSAFSRKSRVKGCRDVSILYAYDVELKEPVCSEVFPGNCIDSSAYAHFIRNNNLSRGIIVADKGFPASAIASELEKRPDLHYLNPLKRDSRKIREYEMLSFDHMVRVRGETVACRKAETKGGLFLYSFRDPKRAEAEEKDYLLRKNEQSDVLDPVDFAKKKERFGTIVFESDQDMPLETVYHCYSDRWQIELLFRSYKNDLLMDRTSVQGDFSVIGNEEINFIASLISSRLLRKADEAGLLEKMSFGDLMEDLSMAWRKVGAPAEPSSDDGGWTCPVKALLPELEALGLSRPAPKPEPLKPGRKKLPKPEFVGPKRPRGRPRKNNVTPDV